MRNRVLRRLAVPLRRIGRVLVFVAPLVLGLAAVSVRAQQLPNISPDQLMQLKQQFGQDGSDAQGLNRAGGNNPPSVTLLPAVPRENANLPQSRLEQIMSARAGVRLRQFGYDQLGQASSVTVPQTGAVQDDYVLGPSDEVVVSLRGQENNEIRASVNRDGTVVLPRLNPVPAMGRTLGDFRRDVEAAVRRSYVATNAYVSMGRLRQVSVLVSGEVNNPGQRLLTGLNSVVDAILLSGGVKKSGSLRSVRVLRGGREIYVDLYSVLTTQGQASIPRLADGDRIIVPPLGPTVTVAGLVRKPGIYELSPRSRDISVRALLNLSGGQEVQGNFRFSILQILPDGRTSLTPVTSQAAAVHDSEVLFVQMGADQTVDQATLAGGTGLAGAYSVKTGSHLSDILKLPGALGNSPYTPFGIIVRKSPQTLMRQLVAFTPVAVLNGREDQILQGDDMVRVLSVRESRLLTFILRSYLTQLARDQERIRNPLSAAGGSDNSLVSQLTDANKQGAELEDLSSVPSSLQRQEITQLLDTPAPDSDVAQMRRELAEQQLQAERRRQLAASGMGAGYSTGPQQQQQQQQQPMLGQQGYLAGPAAGQQFGNAGLGADPAYGTQWPPNFATRARPAVSQGLEQDQNAEDLSPNFSDQTAPAGGFASNREVQTFGQLARQLDIDPLVLINFLLDHRAQLDGAVRGPGSYFVGPNVTLDDLVQAAGGTVNWADESGVELVSTLVDRDTGRSQSSRRTLPLHKGMLASYVVQPRDQFRFSQVSTDVGVGSVTVQGEVQFPGTFPILRGEHLSDLLARAGGLTGQAYPNGTVFLRKSAAQAERQAYAREADEIQNQLVVAMTRVGSGKIDPNTFNSMQAFVSEVRNHQALGRVSLVADPKVLAAYPARDPLLEAGDVVYIPAQPTTVAVLGQVLQPGNFTYAKGRTIEDYIAQAGGYSSVADESHTYIVLPNGEARKVEKSWLSFDVASLPPGSSIVVPREIAPLDLRQTIIDVSQIFSQFAVSIASIAVLAKQ